ncbi:MAG: hypothetical protein M3O71_17475 [Bacteroidota bacterium]|nr:hypothetical protein [Bacteroidota bacterium]
MLNLNLQQKLHYALRFASAMCFIGHGSFGIITKPIWCNYFAVAGIGKAMSYQLMPWVGTFDIICGVILLIYPLRVVALWLVVWGTATALMRPLSGEPFAEFIERAGNFGAPLALLMLSGGVKLNIKNLFTSLSPDIQPDDKALLRATSCLKVIVFLLLAGHGWLNLLGKKGLMGQYTSLGFSDPVGVGHLIGALEIASAISVLIKPIRPVLLIFLAWKAISELFYPHYEIFEWVERGGSYGCILALWFTLGWKTLHSQSLDKLQAA